MELDKAAVERERARLSGDNAALRAALKRYLDGLGVSEEVLRDANSLLMVSTRQLAPAEERTMRRPPNAPPVLVLAGAHVR